MKDNVIKKTTFVIILAIFNIDSIAYHPGQQSMGVPKSLEKKNLTSFAYKISPLCVW